MIYFFPPLSAHPSSSSLEKHPLLSVRAGLGSRILWRDSHLFPDVDRWNGLQDCKSKFRRKQQSKQLCHKKWAKPENSLTVVSITYHYSPQIRGKSPSASLWSRSLTSMRRVKPLHQDQPRSFTAVRYLPKPCAVFPVHNLGGFVTCQA